MRQELGIQHTCQRCTKRKPTTRRRTIYTPAYMGPCGDSFCSASCDSETCFPLVVTVCDPCSKMLGSEEVRR